MIHAVQWFLRPDWKTSKIGALPEMCLVDSTLFLIFDKKLSFKKKKKQPTLLISGLFLIRGKFKVCLWGLDLQTAVTASTDDP